MYTCPQVSAIIQQLFAEMDSTNRGYVEVEQAVQWVEDHPEALTHTRKTALLQHLAPALVQDRAGAAAAKARSV